MKFEYDAKKSIANKKKHGIHFEAAKALWSVLSVEVAAKTKDEPRYMIIGKIKGKCYSCIYTVRNDAIRLISARRSRQSEEEIYNDCFKK